MPIDMSPINCKNLNTKYTGMMIGAKQIKRISLIIYPPYISIVLFLRIAFSISEVNIV